MIVNGKKLLAASPIADMSPTKNREHGVSWGLSEVGYDIRVKQEIRWVPPSPLEAMALFEERHSYDKDIFIVQFNRAFHGYTVVELGDEVVTKVGRTALSSSVERFNIPNGLWCEFRNKSTHARCFVDSTLGTDGEPGWGGYLTIEVVFHDLAPVTIPANSAILKAVFHEVAEPAYYPPDAKYQNQPDRPVAAIFEKQKARF